MSVDISEAGQDARVRDLRLYALAAVLLAAAAIRFWGLGAPPIWMDEGYSIWFSDQGWGYLWSEVPKFENHPSLYYMVLKGWRDVAGSAEFALRTPTAVAGIGVVALIFAAGRTVGQALGDGARGWALGLTAAALAAFSQFQIAFSQEARPYELAALGVALMMAGTLRVVLGAPERSDRAGTPGRRDDTGTPGRRDDTGTPGRRDGTRSAWGAAALVAGMALTLWSHALGLVAAGLTGLFLIGWWALARRDAGGFWRLALMAAAVLALTWPHLLNVLDQATRDYGEFWIDAPDLPRLAKITVLAVGLPGLPGGAPVQILVAAVLLPAGLVGLRRMAAGTVPEGRWASVAAYLVLMIAGFWLVTTAFTYLVQPVLLPRTLIFVSPAALLLTAAAPFALPRWHRAAAGALVVVALGCALAPREVQVYSRPFADIARQAAGTPGAPVLAVAGDSQLLLEYYEEQLDLELDIRPVPGPFPHLRPDGLPDLIGNPELDPATARQAAAALGDAPVAWLMIRRVHFEAGEALRAAVRATGRTETELLGGEPGDLVTWLRYDLAPGAAGE